MHEWLTLLAAQPPEPASNPLMATEVIVAIIAFMGIIITALLTYLGVKRSSDSSRVTHLETRLNNSDAINRGMWIWNRGLQDQVYRRDEPPPIDAPEWLKTLLDK